MDDDDGYDSDCPERREAGDEEHPPAPAGDGVVPNDAPPREPAPSAEPASSSAPSASAAMGVPNEGNSG